ncbi:MAG: hypothetical protein LBF60_04730, partial [Treponema sp.]|nr:hypothetical protein [Treponema sp.]
MKKELGKPLNIGSNENEKIEPVPKRNLRLRTCGCEPAVANLRLRTCGCEPAVANLRLRTCGCEPD